jgi:hypothetical protein
MKKNIPKTGVADIMREWMKARAGNITERRFTTCEMAEALGVMLKTSGAPALWDARAKLRDALKDFIKRGEVKVLIYAKRNRRQFLYVHDWRKELKGKINRKLFKAMYVSQDFSVTDIKRLTGLIDRNWIDKLVRKLKKDGYIQQIQRRLCAHGSGVEAIWHIVNRDKFNTELMREKK